MVSPHSPLNASTETAGFGLGLTVDNAPAANAPAVDNAPAANIHVANAQVLSDRQQSIALTLKLLRQTLHTYDRYQTEVLRSEKITPAQFSVLFHLQQAASPMPMGTLASQLHITQSTLTGLVKRLEQKQWIHRIPQENDRRCIHLDLTPAGVTLMNRLTSYYRSQECQTLRTFDLAELDLLRVLLCKLEQTFHQALNS